MSNGPEVLMVDGAQKRLRWYTRPMAYTTHRGKRVSKAHAAMLRAYERKVGRQVNINQGARTIAEQAKFYAHYLRYGSPLAAKPFPGAPHIKYGRSNHAMDINAPEPAHSVADFYRANGVPVAFNVPNEAWHMDTLDNKKLLAAARRLDAIEPTLKRGSKGGNVVRLKKLLYAKGIRDFSGSPKRPNSNRYSLVFGTNTSAAVKRFQKRNGLHPDGVVGPTTWRYLHR